MSRLFLATDLSLNRSVVVKVLPPELAGEVNAARFQREIAVAAHFQHPHIIPILSAGAGESLLYYTMPFVEGESLQQRMTREGTLPAADAYRLLAEIADALAYAHARGVIHRDVKPSNIMISGEHAMLVDFGVAQAVEEAIDVTARATSSVRPSTWRPSSSSLRPTSTDAPTSTRSASSSSRCSRDGSPMRSPPTARHRHRGSFGHRGRSPACVRRSRAS